MPTVSRIVEFPIGCQASQQLDALQPFWLELRQINFERKVWDGTLQAPQDARFMTLDVDFDKEREAAQTASHRLSGSRATSD